MPMQLHALVTFVAASALLIAARPRPQGLECDVEPMLELRRAKDTSRGGWTARIAGDLDQDGFAEVIVGAPRDAEKGKSFGSARTFAGRSGKLMHVFEEEDGSPSLAAAVAGVGDVDGDGFGDLALGDPDGGASRSGVVRVYSGRSGELLHALEGPRSRSGFGFSVEGAGDVNQDGLDDVVVGAPFDDERGAQAGRVLVFSGKSGELLFDRPGARAGDRLGWSVGGAGDVDGDAFDDVVAGATQEPALGPGYAVVLSGNKGKLLHEIEGEAKADAFGWSVDGAGDVDANGMGDVIVGAPRAAQGSGRAYVHSGRSGKRLHTLAVPAKGTTIPQGDAAAFGYAVSGAGDVDNDGYDDLVVGAPKAGSALGATGAAFVVSGKDGRIFCVLRGDVAEGAFGISVDGGGDLDGDSFSDVLVAATGGDANGPALGAVRAWSGKQLQDR